MDLFSPTGPLQWWYNMFAGNAIFVFPMAAVLMICPSSVIYVWVLFCWRWDLFSKE